MHRRQTDLSSLFARFFFNVSLIFVYAINYSNWHQRNVTLLQHLCVVDAHRHNGMLSSMKSYHKRKKLLHLNSFSLMILCISWISVHLAFIDWQWGTYGWAMLIEHLNYFCLNESLQWKPKKRVWEKSLAIGGEKL